MGISTCPNDTYAFAALLENRVEVDDLRLQIELLDIDQLNDRLAAGTLDIAKASFAAALALGDQIRVLPVGSALGFGVGPLLLSRPGLTGSSLADRPPPAPMSHRDPTRILTPGADTTATLLLRLFHAKQLSSPQTELKHVVFSAILPALAAGQADYGVCIHEGRFTYNASGLELIEDLGARWEHETNLPLPLGGLFARRRVATEVARRVTDLIGQSLRSAHHRPASALPAMRRYAAEFDDGVLMKHVDLYVNQWTADLGVTGRRAIASLASAARAAAVLRKSSGSLQVLQ